MRILISILLFSSFCQSQNIAIYLWGQSNMCGKCSLAVQPDLFVVNSTPRINNLQIYNGSDFVNYNITNSDNPAQNSVTGIELTLAYDLIKRNLYDTVFVIKYAKSGAPLNNGSYGAGSWNVARLADLWAACAIYFRAAKLDLTIHNIDTSIVIGWEGETDANNQTWTNNLQNNYENIIDSLRAATSDATIPHYIINIDSNITSTYKYQVQVILQTIATQPNNYIISSDAYPCADGSHLACVDYYDFGIKISRIIFPNKKYEVLK